VSNGWPTGKVSDVMDGWQTSRTRKLCDATEHASDETSVVLWRIVRLCRVDDGARSGSLAGFHDSG
jgi:hypothetical protein